MIRYADDFVAMSNDTIAGVQEAKRDIKTFLETELHLELSEEKTLITHVNDGFTFLGFHIQRVKPQRKWVVHLRPAEKAKERVKAKIKDLTSRNWSWMDEFTRLTTLNAIVRGWAGYYRHTSLLSDIDEIARYVWFRYLAWLEKKHQGSRPGQLVKAKTRVIHNRMRWTAVIREGDNTLEAYQWMPTRKELARSHYYQKRIPHPYIWTGEPSYTDYPMGQMGPDERIYTDTIGVPHKHEPREVTEQKLRAKVRDGFRCVRCGATENLDVHHIKGRKSHRLEDLETLCEDCHDTVTYNRQRTQPNGEPDEVKVSHPVREGA
jgi:RNA-directed DNA polymerase